MNMDKSAKDNAVNTVMDAISRKNGPSKVKPGVNLVNLASDLAKRKMDSIKSIKLKVKC